jgi:putative transposase
MISFIDAHRSVLGVEPICRLLPIAPSTYYEVIAKRTDVDRLSARARRDIAMKVEIRRVFNENFQVYGVRKVWRQLLREGYDIARCTVARLMRAMGLQGIIRGNRGHPHTHRRDPSHRPGSSALQGRSQGYAPVLSAFPP